MSRGYATRRLMISGCSCFRNLGTAALMNSVSLTNVTMKASTVTSRAAQTSERNCWMNGAGVPAACAAAAGGGSTAAATGCTATAGADAAADASASATSGSGSTAT